MKQQKYFKEYTELKIFSEKEKKEFEKKLNSQFGIEKVEGLILQRGAERIFFYQGSLTPDQIKDLEHTLPIERVGTYIGKEFHGEIRLSIEGTHIFKDQITKNIFELNEQQADDWMKGREILIKTGKKDFLIIKYKNEFLGTGKASAEKITNFIPKNRRLKERN